MRSTWSWLALATIVGIVVLRPDALVAQLPTKSPSVGIIFAGAADDPLQAVRKQALREAGYVEGQTIDVYWRFADGHSERLPTLARELVTRHVAAIVTFGSAATAAARGATTKIPIVAVGDDLVAEGQVASLARPGGNVTGVSILATELDLKRLEVLKQAVPGASRVTIFRDATIPGGHVAALQAGAQTMGITLQTLEIRSAKDLESAFQAAQGWRAQGLNVLASPLLWGFRRTIIELAAKHRLPVIYQWPESVRDGGLMGYGPTISGMYRLTFDVLDKVLKGARPSELPVVQPSEFKLALNLRTARAIGLTIPSSMVARADQIIR
jgi:putative ABC transport system substrate-binding protein